MQDQKSRFGFCMTAPRIGMNDAEFKGISGFNYISPVINSCSFAKVLSQRENEVVNPSYDDG